MARIDAGLQNKKQDGPTEPVTWRFASAVFDEGNGELRVDGEVVVLEPKARDTLLCLLRAEGELVTKDELFETVWGPQGATDDLLLRQVRQIRAVLGDESGAMLRPVQGHGFRLDVPITMEGTIAESGTHLEFEVGQSVPGLDDWTLDERLQIRPSNELWRIRNNAGELGVIKLALDARAVRALRREVTLNRVLLKELGDDPPLVRLTAWQFDITPCWIRMPWYPAGSLTDWVAAQGGAEHVPIERRVRIVAEAAAAFAKAHALGVMHKDIKPGNLLVDESDAEPRLLLCDFGNGTAHSRDRLARTGVTLMGFTQTLAAENHTGSGSSSATGTPSYMAPEILQGEVFSERSDVFSLGVMLYQLISGRMQSPLAPGWEEDISDAGMQRIIASACAGKPQRRTASMFDLAEQLYTWVPGAAGPAVVESDGMRLSAIMFTDMVGYSSLVRRDESIARTLLDQHLAMVRMLLPKHSGNELETIGDAFMLGFPSAVLAVQCAIEIQQAQADYNETADQQRQFQIRVGIHIGDVEYRDGKIFGHGVNFAARIEPLSPPGGLAVSPAVRDAVEARLNLPFHSLGRKKLKNVAENVEVFALDAAAIRDPENVRPRRTWRPQSWMPGLTVAMGVLLLVVGARLAFLQPPTETPDAEIQRAIPAEERVRVAILPFSLLGVDEQYAQVMIGLQEALASELSSRGGWQLVLGRNLSAMGLAEASDTRIGNALNAQRLIRGSVQQVGEHLRVNVQLVNSNDGTTVWARSLLGERAELFALQSRIGDAIHVELGGKPSAPTVASMDAAGYEAYLAALTAYRAYPWIPQDAEQIDDLFEQLAIAAERVADHIPVHLLAIQAEATAYWYSWRVEDETRAAIHRHLAALQALGASPVQLAVARSARSLFVDNRPEQAWRYLEPHRVRVLADPDSAQIYLEALRGMGQLDQVIALGEVLVREQPGDLIAHMRLGTDYHLKGEIVPMLDRFLAAASRFPKVAFIHHYATFYAWLLSGEIRVLEPGLAWPAGSARAEASWKWERFLALKRGDMGRLRELLETGTLPREVRWFGTEYRPSELRHARTLRDAIGDPLEVQIFAKRALAKITHMRERSDTPARQIAAAMALALLDRREEAQSVLDQAISARGAKSNRLAVTNDDTQTAIVLAQIGDVGELMAFLREFVRNEVFRGSCGYLANGFNTAGVRKFPEVAELIAQEANCEPLFRKNRQALMPYLTRP